MGCGGVGGEVLWSGSMFFWGGEFDVTCMHILHTHVLNIRKIQKSLDHLLMMIMISHPLTIPLRVYECGC